MSEETKYRGKRDLVQRQKRPKIRGRKNVPQHLGTILLLIASSNCEVGNSPPPPPPPDPKFGTLPPPDLAPPPPILKILSKLAFTLKLELELGAGTLRPPPEKKVGALAATRGDAKELTRRAPKMPPFCHEAVCRMPAVCAR